MALLEVACPYCGDKIPLTDELRDTGIKVRCLKCSREFGISGEKELHNYLIIQERMKWALSMIGGEPLSRQIFLH